MSAAEANGGNNIVEEEAAAAGGGGVNEEETAAPPLPPPEDEAARGGGGDLGDNAMLDLSPYFNTLIDTLHRSNENAANQNAAAGENNANNNAPQLRSMISSLLWNGAEQIATATRASFQGQGGSLFAVDTFGGQNNNNVAAAVAAAAIFPPKFAAVYLYAVAQNIDALEEIVQVGHQGAVMDGGISIKQVAEIVSVSVRDLLSVTFERLVKQMLTLFICILTLLLSITNRLLALLQYFAILET